MGALVPSRVHGHGAGGGRQARYGPGARLGAAAVVVLLIGGAAGYGLTRSEPDVVGALRIGGVQPGVVDDRRERLAI